MPERKLNQKSDEEKLEVINRACAYDTLTGTEELWSEAGKLWIDVKRLKMMADLDVSYKARGIEKDEWDAIFAEKSERLKKLSPVLYDNLFKEPEDERNAYESKNHTED